MDNLSRLLSLLAPTCSVNLHCRFTGRWDADHPQQADGIVPWHVILRGETRLIVEGKTFDVRAGDIILFPHGSPHLLQSLVDWGQVVPAQVNNNGIVTEVWTEGPGPAVEVLCGDFHFGPGYRWMFADETTLIHLHADEQHDFPELETLLGMLVRESLGGLPGSTSIVKGLADTLLALILRILLSLHEPPAGVLRLLSDTRLAPAILAVIADPASPWTMESMAKRCFLSRATFARHFSYSYHQTPQVWLNQLRMVLAARLLSEEKNLSAERVAEQCGFLSLSSFSKAFKKTWGITPALYRKRGYSTTTTGNELTQVDKINRQRAEN